MLAAGSYAEICSRFVWQVPAQFNIGVAVCDCWATGESRPALIYEDPAGNVRTFSFDELKTLTDCLANVLAAHGIERGDRVGILLPQRPETALSHIAVYKMGAVALPLFTQFGPEALEHRLQHSAARAVVTDGENLPKIEAIRSFLPELRYVLIVDGETGAHTDFWAALERASSNFTAVDTASEDPALIIYTSGTTGKPKGALHAHRVLLGHTSLAYNFPMNSSRSPATNSGRPPIGPGPAGCSMCCCRACTSAFPWSHTEPASSTLNMLSISSPSTRCGTHSYRRLRSS
jgi:acetyl-CoA synthetase